MTHHEIINEKLERFCITLTEGIRQIQCTNQFTQYTMQSDHIVIDFIFRTDDIPSWACIQPKGTSGLRISINLCDWDKLNNINL